MINWVEINFIRIDYFLTSRNQLQEMVKLDDSGTLKWI